MIAWILLMLILLVSNSNGFYKNVKPGKARQGGFDAGAGFNKVGEFVVPGKAEKFCQKKINFKYIFLNVYLYHNGPILCQFVIKRLT